MATLTAMGFRALRCLQLPDGGVLKMQLKTAFRWLIVAALILGGATLCQEARGQGVAITPDSLELAAVKTELSNVKTAVNDLQVDQRDLLREIRESYVKGPVYRQDLQEHRRETDQRLTALDARLIILEMWRYALGVAFAVLLSIVGWLLKKFYVVFKQETKDKE